MKNMVPTFGKDEHKDTEFVKQSEYEAKVLEIENSLKEKAARDEIPTIPDHSIYLQEHHLEPYAKKEQIPEIPDHSIYALKEEIPEPIDTSNLVKKEEVEKFATKDQLPDLTPYLKKSELPPEKDLSEYAKKEDLPDLKPYIKKENLPDFNTLATKAELELKASIGDMAKKVSIEDMEKYKSAIDESLKSKLNKSETYTRQEVKDRYVKKEIHQKDLEKKLDKIALPDFESFAKKSDLDGLVGKECVDLKPFVRKDTPQMDWHSYCLVKLEQDFRFYDGVDWEFETYMGARGNWKTESLYQGKLDKPSEFLFWTPFDGIFHIDFCCTVRRDTHTFKPHVLQRIRTSQREVVNFEYFDNSSSIMGSGHDVTVRSFIKTASLWLPKNAWIRFSMQFTNRSYNNKKQWLHCVGSGGGYTPTYLSIHGIRMK